MSISTFLYRRIKDFTNGMLFTNEALKRNKMNHNKHNSSTGEAKMGDSNTSAGGLEKLHAFLAGLTPATIFKLTFFTSVVIVIAANIIWHTAMDSFNVNVNKVEMDSVVLDGSHDLGGIELGGYSSLEYEIKNQSTKPAYVFVRIEMRTPGLYEVVGASGEYSPDGWSRVENEVASDELVYAYTGEIGGGSSGENVEMEPVSIGDSVAFTGRLHCLADVLTYADLTWDDMNFEITGCLVYGVGENGENVGYDTGAENLWVKFLENKD